MRILIVEDNAVAGSALSDFFRHKGHTVEWAATMTEAEAKATVLLPDAIVLDLNLNHDPPQRVFDRAKMLPGGKHIMVLTAMPEDQLPPLPGVTRVIKPADPEVLVAKLEEAVSK